MNSTEVILEAFVRIEIEFAVVVRKIAASEKTRRYYVQCQAETLITVSQQVSASLLHRITRTISEERDRADGAAFSIFRGI